MEDINALLNGLQGFEPEVIEDVDFEPIKGAYEARVDSISRKTGTSQRGNAYDMYSFNIQITKTIEGDRGENRFLNKTYNMIQTEFATPEENLKRLINDLFTCGITYNLSSDAEFEASLAAAKDKTVYVRTWIRKDKDDNKYQSVKFIKEIKGKGKDVKSPF